MKPQNNILHHLGFIALAFAGISAPLAHAASDTWVGTTDATWATSTNWLGGSVPATGDTATFNGAGNANTTINLGGGVTLGSILFDTPSAAAYTIGSGAVGSQTLTLGTVGNAITLNPTVAANQLINANLSLSVTRTVATPSTYYAVINNTANTLTLAGGINANSAGVKVLNVTGSGNTTISGAITSGTGNMSLFKTGSGALTLSGGGTFSGVGVRDGAAFDSSAVFREGTTILNGGTYNNSGGELVIGGVDTHGGAGTNTTLQLENGTTLNGISWLSVGRGNGNGTATSNLTLNGNATSTSTNLSTGFNAGNAGNIPKGTITLNGTSILTATNIVNFAESAGSNFTMNINDTATFRQTANADQTKVGINNGAIGVINVNGGTATFERDFILGAGGTGSGKLVLASGTVNVANSTERWLKLNDSASASTGQIDVNGGNLNLNTNTDLRFSTNGTASGTNVVNLNTGGAITGWAGNGTGGFSGTSVVDLNQASTQAGVNNTFNLNGGTLTIGQVLSTRNEGIAAFNFNGGELRAAAASGAFIDLGGGNQRVNVRDGGAIINTNGVDVTVPQALVHSNILTNNPVTGTPDAAIDGGLTKNGLGALTLTGASSYTGATLVNAGTLRVNSSLNAASAVSVASGGTLGGSGTVGNVTVNGGVVSNGTGAVGNTAKLTLGSLTFSSAGSFSLNKANDTGTVALTITGALTTTPGITLNMPTAPLWANGSMYFLIGYGTFTGSASDITVGALAGLGARQTATIGDTGPTDGFITVAVEGDAPFWTGKESNAWTTTPGTGLKNWQLVDAGTPTDFLTNDQVLFNDDATANTSINISTANVGVASVTFDNTTKDYSISSTGGFGIENSSGSAPLIKNGTGIVTLTTNNSFTGATSVNAGTLVLSGSNAASATTVANGATLELANASALTGTLTLNSGSTLSLRADADTTFTPANFTGAAGTSTIAVDQLTGAGAGKTLTLANSYTAGATGSSLTVSSTSGDTLLLSSQLNMANAVAPTTTINLSGANLTLNAGVFYNFATNGPLLVVNANSNTLLINGNYTTGTNRWAGIQVNSGTVTMANGQNGGAGVNNGVYTVLNGGTLNLNNANAIGGAAAGNNFAINGGTLDNTSGSAKTLSKNPVTTINANFAFSTSGGTSANDLSLGTNTVSLGTAAGTARTITTNGSATLTIGGIISNGTTANGLIKAGTGTLSLTGTNTYTGDTTVTAGTLAVDGDAIPNTGKLVVSGGQVDPKGATELVGSLYFGAVLQPAGTYSAVAGPGVDFVDTVHFTGTGVVSVVAGYSAWANANGATGQTKDLDHDNDGVKNGIEYFMGQTGSTFTANPAQVGGTVTWPMGATYTGVYGTDYVVQSSTDLVTWIQVPIGTGDNTVAVNPGPTPARSVVYDMPTGGTSFVRLVVKN